MYGKWILVTWGKERLFALININIKIPKKL